MESIFFVITYFAGFFNGTRKKIGSVFSKPYHFLVNFFHGRSKSKEIEDVQELTDEEYNCRFGKFFPKFNEEGELTQYTFLGSISASQINSDLDSNNFCKMDSNSQLSEEFSENFKRGAGIYGSLGEAIANGAHCGPSDGGPGFYS